MGKCKLRPGSLTLKLCSTGRERDEIERRTRLLMISDTMQETEEKMVLQAGIGHHRFTKCIDVLGSSSYSLSHKGGPDQFVLPGILV